MLRIGEISYLNCTPLFTALRNKYQDKGYRFVAGHPAELNAKLRSGAIDVCPSSSIEYARNPASYIILPDLSISAIGSVMSVLLFSKQPLETLNGASIGLTSESETSVILLKVLLARKYSFTNSYYCADSHDPDQHDALLLIGDSALRAAAVSRGGYVYDLGELWHQFTGLPFVFALWLLRADAMEKYPVAVDLFHERLVSSKFTALKSFAQIADACKQKEWTNSSFLIKYWNIISYDLTKSHLEGLLLFYRYAADCCCIESVPELRLLEK